MRISAIAGGLVAFLAATSLAAAKDWKTIRIGTEGAYAPFNFKDADGKLQGFDIDIAMAICEKLKAECPVIAQPSAAAASRAAARGAWPSPAASMARDAC